jgi:hypothetical protein
VGGAVCGIEFQIVEGWREYIGDVELKMNPEFVLRILNCGLFCSVDRGRAPFFGIDIICMPGAIGGMAVLRIYPKN